MRRSIFLSVASNRNEYPMRRLTILAGLVSVTAAGIAFAEAPLSFSASGHVVAPVRVDGGDQHLFVVDTGADESAVYSRFAREAGLELAGQEKIVGQTGAASLPLRRIARLELDGRTVGPVTASELPDRPDGAVIAGIIGIDVLGSCFVDFDLPSARIALLTGTGRKA
jgi:hypothetical protein